MCDHVLQYLIAAVGGILWIYEGVVVGCCFQHTHKNGSFLHLQVLGGGIEVGLCCSLDSVGIRSEVNSVGIHVYDFLLVVTDF